MAKPIVYELSVGGGVSAETANQLVGQQVSTGAGNTSITTQPVSGVVTGIGNYILSNVHINVVGTSTSGDVMTPIKGVDSAVNQGLLGEGGKPIGSMTGALKQINDITAVGNNLMAGRILEASMETAGVFTGAAGGAGALYALQTGLQLAGISPTGLAVRAFSAGVFVYADIQTGDAGKDLVYGEWIRQAAPTLDNALALQPSYTNADGTSYYVISATGPDKQPQTFVYTDNPVNASMGSGEWNRYLPVVQQQVAGAVVSAVLKDSGFNPNMTAAEWHASQGRSMSGYQNNAIEYEAHGPVLTVGVGPNAEVRQAVAMVTTYRDEATQAIIEMRVQGELVNGEFRPTGGAYAQGMTPDGKVVIPGVVDNPNAQTQQLQDTFIQGEAAYANSFGPDGKPWGTSTSVAPNATQTWQQGSNSATVMRITEITNGSGTVTRDVTVVDRATGQVAAQFVYEDGRLVQTTDHQSGVVWTINRDSGQMEPRVDLSGNTQYVIDGQGNIGVAGADGSATFVVSGVGLDGVALVLTVRADGVITGQSSQGEVGELQLDAETAQDILSGRQGIQQVLDDQADAFSVLGQTQSSQDMLSGLDIGTVPEPGAPITVVADSGSGVTTDAGPINGYGDGTSHPSSPAPSQPSGQNLTEWSAVVGGQTAQALIGLLTLEGWSAEDINALSLYPLADGTSILANAEGEIAGTVSPVTLVDGTLQGWQQVQLNGQSEPVYLPPQGGNPVSAQEFTNAQAQDASNAIGVFTTVANGLNNWSDLSDAQRLSTLVSLYNQIDNLGAAVGALQGVDASLLPGDMGQAAGAISGAMSLYYGLENGNELQAISGAVQLYNTFSGNQIPYVGVVLALADVEENPWGAVAAALAQWGGPYGMIAAAVINVVLMMQDVDPSVGEASASIDASGAIVVDTTVNEEGGGSTAAHWAQALAQAALGAGMSAPQAGAPAQHLPSVGYYFDPDGFNFTGSQGQLALRWTDEHGQTHQILYGSDGMRWDGDSVEGQSDIMRDYMALIQSMEPNWPPVMYQQVEGGILQLDYGVATVLYATALGTFDGQQAHTQGGDEDTDGGQELIDVGNSLLFSTRDNTITNSTGQQTRVTITDGQLTTVPAAIGANPAGPQIPVGRNPIVFVPVGAMTGQSERTVTAGMISSLSQLGSMTDAQLAAIAMALGASALPFLSHANTLGNPQGDGGNNPDANGAPERTFTDAQGNVWSLSALAAAVDAALQGGSAWGVDWAGGVRPSETGSSATTSDLQNLGGTNPGAGENGNNAPVVETPELTSLAGPEAPGTAATTPQPNWQTSIDPGAPPLQAGDDLALDYPEVGNDQVQGLEDGLLRLSAIDLLGNDHTPNPVPRGESGDYWNGLRIVSVGNPVNGRVGIENGQVVFIPDENVNGQAGFTYTVVDMYGLTHTGTVSVNLQPVNDAPVVRGESATGSEDATLLFTSGSLLSNDHDIDGDRLRISRVGEATGGVVTLLPNGSVSFVPTPNYNGPAGYSYWVSDGDEAVRTEVRLNILQVNDLPQVQGELVASDEDVVLNFPIATLLANDSDIDTDPLLNQTGVQTLTISSVGNAQHGTVQIVDGQVRFVPEQNYFGPASFDYLVDDGAGGRVSATVVLVLAPVNDAPAVQGESETLAEDHTLLYTQAQLLANDSDVDNAHSDLHITQVGGAVNGSVELLPNGDIRFVPDADYFGPAQFDYLVEDGVGGQSLATVTLEVTPVNDAPRLQGEQVTLDEDTIATMSATQLLANDHDVDNAHSELVITSVGDAQHGTVSMDEQGQITFTPTANYYGTASFSYTVSDGVGGSSTSTVQLDYQSVNDVPVVNGELMIGYRGVTYTYTQAALLANDTDVEHPAGLQIVAVGAAENGEVTLLPDGRIQFVPAGGYESWDPETYASFEYTVRDPDGGESTTSTVIDYSRINTNPVAVNDSFHGYEDVRLSINVSELTRNDHDPDGHAITVDQVANASHGSVSLSNGVVSFTPSPDYWGGASFQYHITDGNGGQTWATAFIDIERANRAPVITGVDIFGGNDATRYFWEGGWTGDTYVEPYSTGSQRVDDPHRINGRIYASDPDGDALTYTVTPLHQPEHGVVFMNSVVGSSAPRYLDHLQLQGRGYIDPYWDPAIPEGGTRNYLTHSTGAWQYVSWKGDGYSGTTSFVITVTDSRGLQTHSDPIQVNHVPWSGGGGGCFPVVVDTGDDGIDLVRPEDSNMFADINGDGWRDQIGWVSSSDALLAYDANGDGLINQANEVSFTTYLPGARTDLEGLAAFDTDGDRQLTSADAQWNQFGLLQDHNDNGVQDEGEWVALQDAGVTHINLTSDGQVVENNGNVVFGETTVGYADGTTHTAGDVMFAGAGVERPEWVEEELADATEPPAQTVAAPVEVVTVAQALTVADAEVAETEVAETEVAETEVAETEVAETEVAQTEVAPPAESVSQQEPEEAASASVTPSIEQQASAFVQAVNTQDVTSDPLGFVDTQSVSLGAGTVTVDDEPVVVVTTFPPSSAATTPTASAALV